MLSLVKKALLTVGKKLILAALSEAVLKKLAIGLLNEIAKRTKTKLDDELLEEIKKALDEPL